MIRNSSGVRTAFLLLGPLRRPLTSPLTIPAVAMDLNTPPVFQFTTSGSTSTHCSPFLK